jgi:hypothetical protein
MSCFMDRPHCYYNCESKSDCSWYDNVYNQLRDAMRPDDNFEDGEFTCPVCGTVMSVRVINEPQFECRVKE